jgi:hypothetical protein
MSNNRKPTPVPMFPDGCDLPLFSGTAPRVEVPQFTPEGPANPRLFPQASMDELAAEVKAQERRRNGR